MFLKVMVYTWNISGNLFAVGQPHTRDFTKRRVRLLRSLRTHNQAHSAFLRTTADIGYSLSTLRLVPGTSN